MENRLNSLTDDRGAWSGSLIGGQNGADSASAFVTPTTRRFFDQ